MSESWGQGAGTPDTAARLDALEARVAQLEAIVAGASGSAGSAGAAQDAGHDVDPWAQPPWPEVMALVRAGRKIEAIKVHRDYFGTGLRESKDAIEQIR